MTDPNGARAYLLAAETRLTSARRDLDRAADRLRKEGRPGTATVARQLADDLSALLEALRSLTNGVRW